MENNLKQKWFFFSWDNSLQTKPNGFNKRSIFKPTSGNNLTCLTRCKPPFTNDQRICLCNISGRRLSMQKYSLFCSPACWGLADTRTGSWGVDRTSRWAHHWLEAGDGLLSYQHQQTLCCISTLSQEHRQKTFSHLYCRAVKWSLLVSI